MDKSITKVAILGRGALGTMYGDFLQEHSKAEVFFLADPSRKERYLKEQITVNGNPVTFNYKTAQQAGIVDLLLVCVKGNELESTVRSVKDVVGDDTVIVSVLNGISSEEIIARTLNKGRIVYCVAQKMDALWKNRSLTYRDFGELCIGITDDSAGSKAALGRLAKFFSASGMPYVIDEYIKHRMWCKWMLNVGVNQTLMIYDDIFALIHKPGEARDFMIKAMREVLELSRCEGVNLSEADFETYLDIIDRLNPEGMPSMRQDRLAKRKSELEFFAGEVFRRAQKYGLETPTNAYVLKKVREIESAY